MALADCNRTLAATSEEGLDPAALPATGANLLPDPPAGMEVEEKRREDIFTVPCDVLVPAAVENAVSERIAQHLAVRAVVPGANLAVTEAADTLLHERDIVVVPDFLAGCGGSLSMEGLFAPDEHPAPEEVLAHVEKRMVGLVGRILARSREEGVSPTVAARRACAEIVPQPGTRPYGRPH
ncbi:MAG: hypothetical protein Kow0089_19620 [Desulfobulbaceae bacterium]